MIAVEVDDALTTGGGTLVTLGPLLDIAVETYRGDVASRYDIHGVAVSQQIGERQTTHVGVVHQFAETYGEGSNLCWQKDIGTTGRLGAALQSAVM